jgi:hypothetical protein
MIALDDVTSSPFPAWNGGRGEVFVCLRNPHNLHCIFFIVPKTRLLLQSHHRVRCQLKVSTPLTRALNAL